MIFNNKVRWNLRIVLVQCETFEYYLRKYANRYSQFKRTHSNYFSATCTKLNVADKLEAAKKARSTAKGKFTQVANNLNQAIDIKATIKTIESRYEE